MRSWRLAVNSFKKVNLTATRWVSTWEDLITVRIDGQSADEARDILASTLSQEVPVVAFGNFAVVSKDRPLAVVNQTLTYTSRPVPGMRAVNLQST